MLCVLLCCVLALADPPPPAVLRTLGLVTRVLNKLRLVRMFCDELEAVLAQGAAEHVAAHVNSVVEEFVSHRAREEDEDEDGCARAGLLLLLRQR